MKPSNWKDYFITQTEFTAKNDPSTFIATSIPSEDRDEKLLLSKLTSDNGESLMIYFSKMSNSIQILHNVTNLGNSNHHPEPLLVALSGLSDSKATPVFINIDSLTTEFEFDAPTNTRLLSTSDANLLNSLEAPSTNQVKAKSFPFILVPPCLWEVILSSTNRSPENLFFEIKEEISNLKEDWEEIDELKDSYKELYVILRFLWAIKKDIIKTVQLEVATDHNIVSNWSKSRHSHCIHEPGPQVSTTNPRERETSELDAFSEVISKLKKSATEDLSESTQKGFNKLYASTKNMILNASAPNSEIKAGSPSKHCSDFLCASKHSGARHFFINELQNYFGCNLEVALGVVMNLFHGIFLRTYDETPSNFSPFSFPKQRLFGGNPESDCLVLLLKESSSKGISNEDIESVLKQGVIVPKTAESLRVSVHNFWGASCFFFSSDSLLPKSIQMINDDIVMNTMIYESLIDQDNEFTAKFLFAIDTNVQLWLKDCKNAVFREDVNDNLIDFKPLLTQVKTRQFNMLLPKSFKHLLDKDSNSSSPLPDHPSKKRKLNNNNNPQDKVDNEGVISEWLVNNDIFSKKLRHSDNLKKRPKMGDFPMCHRWHSKGYCFGNCTNISTHTESSKLTNDQKEKYSSWLKKSLKD